MPASRALVILIGCAQFARSALSDDVNDDPVLDKVEKKSALDSCLMFAISEPGY
jgi:hypothetical protein